MTHRGKRHGKRTRRRHLRGGSNMFGNSYENVSNSGGSSGWSYMNNLVGNLDDQYNKTLMGNGSGNTLNVRGSTMSGGRRRRRNRSRRNRRGGSFAPAVADAVVPLGLFALQQTYGKRGSRKSRRTRRR